MPDTSSSRLSLAWIRVEYQSNTNQMYLVGFN